MIHYIITTRDGEIDCYFSSHKKAVALFEKLGFICIIGIRID